MSERVQSVPFVVRREEIPAVVSPGSANLEVRHFLDHPLLSNAVPSSVELAWVAAPSGATCALPPRSYPSMLMVLQGSAQMASGAGRWVEVGDVVTLPSDADCGTVTAGPDGLAALIAQLRGSAEGRLDEGSSTLEALLEHNQKRLGEIVQNPYFLLLSNGTYQSAQKRTRFRDYARVFSDAFQAFLFARQALCRDDASLATFHEHLVEEIGHNKLLQLSGEARRFDPVLEASSVWFAQQMLVLDNAGKAVVTLVLETGGYHFHSLANRAFVGDVSSEYFHTHAEGDEHHKDMGLELLQGLHPRTYARLQRIMDDSWDMLDVMTRRLATLIERADFSS